MICNVTEDSHKDLSDVFVGYFTYVIWFILLPIVILNSLMIFVILSNKNLQKRRSNKFAVSLFLSHVLNGFSGFTEAGIVIITKDTSLSKIGKNEWQFYFLILWVVITSAIFINMLLIVVDRFMAIRYPFFYQNTNTRTLVSYTLLIGNTPYTLGCIVYVIKGLSLGTFTFVVITPVVLCFVVYANSVVYMQTRKQFKDIVKLTVSNDHTENTKERQRLAKRQLRSLCICLFLMSSFLIAWLPMVGLLLYGYATAGLLCIGENPPIFVLAWWSLNSVADPIIYASFNRDVKSKLKQISTNFRKSK
ncbi:G-protein coupled receptor 161-like [Hydractinia symbiolongicarpus]|uniref:G-protein coupled receptor 161-like n=1 Tax=Hydractinia symbiolongicarpus TaxID=13093 RepID=UPI002549C5A3|nr:G-protein coupled receptor 161-like [Hydractinia symbiolongicarpus]